MWSEILRNVSVLLPMDILKQPDLGMSRNIDTLVACLAMHLHIDGTFPNKVVCQGTRKRNVETCVVKHFTYHFHLAPDISQYLQLKEQRLHTKILPQPKCKEKVVLSYFSCFHLPSESLTFSLIYRYSELP